MKKVMLLFLGLFLFFFVGLFAFIVANMGTSVSVEVLAQELSQGEKAVPKVPTEEKEEITDGTSLLTSHDYTLKDNHNRALNPTATWESRQIPLVKVGVKNLLGMTLVDLSYSLEVETNPDGGILTVAVRRAGKVAKTLFMPWNVYLTATAIKHHSKGRKSYKDYQIQIYLFREGMDTSKYFEKKIRLWADGKTEQL